MPAASGAQGAVSGRVSITERPGETTTDFGSTVVYLVPKDSALIRTRPGRASLSMSGRQFVPHVRVVTPGSKVEFPNQDPFSHNVFSNSALGAFDLGLYRTGKSRAANGPKAKAAVSAAKAGASGATAVSGAKAGASAAMGPIPSKPVASIQRNQCLRNALSMPAIGQSPPDVSPSMVA